MQGWIAPVIGTALGLSMVAAAAVLVLPERPGVDIAPLVRAVLQRAVPVRAPVATLPAAALPEVVEKLPAPAVAPPVPVIAPGAMVRPLPPPMAVPEARFGIDGLLRPPPGDWLTGTGFFINSRGAILTAAHVVQGCTRVRVMSAHMRPETAEIVATDAANDIALLAVRGLASPAWLPVVGPSRAAGRLLVLGFPAGALPDTPNETWAALANAAFAPNAPVQTDPSRLVWFRSGVVTHGYSGGPVVDLASGRVVGMVSSGMDAKRMPMFHGVDTAGLNLGPGAVPMLAMMSQHTVREGVVPAGMGVESALEMTRQATVRVVCTK